MKRSKGLRRDGPKAREFAAKRGQLKRDPESARAFERRQREGTAAWLRARGGRRATPPWEGPLDPRSWREAVFTASGGRCIVRRTRARDVDDRRFHAHHPLPKGVLRGRGLHAFVWDPRNGAWVQADVHMQHEAPGVRADHRIARHLLPGSVWDFCRELDALAGYPWATETVRRLHPAADGGMNE